MMPTPVNARRATLAGSGATMRVDVPLEEMRLPVLPLARKLVAFRLVGVAVTTLLLVVMVPEESVTELPVVTLPRNEK